MLKKFLFTSFAVTITAITLLISGGIASASGITASPICPVFSRSLSIRISGTDVTQLQTYLNAQGYLTVNPTGYFGPLTQSAVAHWQANGGVVALGGYGSGTFGPLSRGYFTRSCGTTGVPGNGYGGTLGSSSTTQNTLNFSATPASGIEPLTVQFVATAPQGTTIGNSVNFGDGASGVLGFVPVCSNCNAMATVSHTYLTTGTYTASLLSGTCACPANGVCNCPNLMILATTSIAVTGSNSSSSAASGIQQLNAPGSVALASGGTAEVRNANFYFALAGITASTATINITSVGCWNSFPSDPPPEVRCMIAVVPTLPQTLSVGQNYTFGNYAITLTNITSSTATFSIL